MKQKRMGLSAAATAKKNKNEITKDSAANCGGVFCTQTQVGSWNSEFGR